jgi:hypothetical protein
MQKITHDYNKKLSDKLLKKAIDNTEDWYSDGVKQNSLELMEWLFSQKQESK